MNLCYPFSSLFIKKIGEGGGGEGGIKEGRSWIFANITHSERANATLW